MTIKPGTKFWLSEIGAKDFLYASDVSYISFDKEISVMEASLLKSGNQKVPVMIEGSNKIFWIDSEDFLSNIYKK